MIKSRWLTYEICRYICIHISAVTLLCYTYTYPASWSSGQSFWLLITRSRVRFPALPWRFPCGRRIPVVTMVWVVTIIRFKVETSVTRSHTSINSWFNPRQRSPRWRGPHHERQPAHQLIEHPSTLIAEYGREKKTCTYNMIFIIQLLKSNIYFIGSPRVNPYNALESSVGC